MPVGDSDLGKGSWNCFLVIAIIDTYFPFLAINTVLCAPDTGLYSSIHAPLIWEASETMQKVRQRYTMTWTTRKVRILANLHTFLEALSQLRRSHPDILQMFVLQIQLANVNWWMLLQMNWYSIHVQDAESGFTNQLQDLQGYLSPFRLLQMYPYRYTFIIIVTE